jgi:aspartate carbamoyltransferase catalytic subunit
MKCLGIKIYVSGPKEFQDGSAKYIEFDQAIKEMDVVMMLRIQYERHSEDINIIEKEYLQQYGLDMAKVKIMKNNSIIMHPAPVNRNVEIGDDVVECEKSKIFTQMENGVYVRMAMILHSLGEDHVNIN